MALNLLIDSVSQFIGGATFNGSWFGGDTACSEGMPNLQFSFGYIESGFQFLTDEFSGGGNNAGSLSQSVDLEKDRNAKVRLIGSDCSVNRQSISTQFKTFADLVAFLNISSIGTSTTTCNIFGAVIPNTNVSLCDVLVQFRVLGTAPWTETGNIADDLQGNNAIGLNGNVTGLLPNTTYEVRFKATRDTENDTIAFSSIIQCTTLPGGPAVTVIVPSALNNIANNLLGQTQSTKIIQAPLLQSTASIPNNDEDIIIISPELTKFVDLDVFMVDFHAILVEMN